MQVLINIDVPDLEHGIAFYEQALPLMLARRLFDGTVAELTGDGVRVYLLEKPLASLPARSIGTRRDYGRHWTPVHLDFVVDDLQAALERAVAAGATQETDIEHEAWGSIVTLSDPFGNGFCLVRFEGGIYEHA